MFTKRGKHGQGVTPWKWLIFHADLDLDVDLGSVFHFPYHWEIATLYDTLTFTRGRHCSSLMSQDILYDIWSLTMARHCIGLGGVCALLSALALIVIFQLNNYVTAISRLKVKDSTAKLSSSTTVDVCECRWAWTVDKRIIRVHCCPLPYDNQSVELVASKSVTQLSIRPHLRFKIPPISTYVYCIYQ